MSEEVSEHTPTLPSLTSWSKSRISATFTAPSPAATLAALDATFARTLRAQVNGDAVDFDGFTAMIAGMAERCAEGGARVDWVWAAEGEDKGDESESGEGEPGKRAGIVRGEYYIRGTFGVIPGTTELVELEVRKRVVARIDSLSKDPVIDSRRIVELDAIVNLLPVGPAAPPRVTGSSCQG
ncbi:unnamed protein product [Mycena citricolor]|uniref:Uncharacterized protein n=1 Tax=Mycena citricolor TaxID=2018698 RepID=A0AAD2Q4S3_9AGAR|nr:unnamed protein product [Mycena citricolor]CAK5276188.1 unnamed protein product [Mycena citricolor]